MTDTLKDRIERYLAVQLHDHRWDAEEHREAAEEILALLYDSEAVRDAKAKYMNLRTCVCGRDAKLHKVTYLTPHCDGFDPDWGSARMWIESIAFSPTPTPDRPAEPTVRDFLAWMEDRPGASWQASINDARYYLEQIAVSRDTEGGEG